MPPFKIQRVPRGLNDLLSTYGGETPIQLEDRIFGMVELLQMYGLNQLQTNTANNAATAENSGPSFVLSATRWTVLFSAHGTIVKTATMTALRASVLLNRVTRDSAIVWASDSLGPFGATETGNCDFGGRLPYPLLCPPGSSVATLLQILGTDATANVSVFAEYGVLG